MRVTERCAAAGRHQASRLAARRARFEELLRHHQAAAPRGGPRAADRPAGRAAPAAGEVPMGDGARAAAGAPPAGQARRTGLAPGRLTDGAGDRPAEGPAAIGDRPPGAPPTGVPSTPEPQRAALTAAVRAVPPAVEAFRLGGREALALDFGAALGVELRRTPGGVELSLAASAALAPAARAELPALLHALAVRGVPVARAAVHERGAPRRRR